MKCPQTFQIEITEDDQIQLAGAGCSEECAWYDKANKTCVINNIKDALQRLGQTLSVK